ncbi:hypothetical protein V6N13_140707 [Hibiscus sabdariffa]
MSEPYYTLKSLRHDVLHEFGTLVSPGKCGRARDMALEMIEGNHKAQYGRIYDYLQELRITNPGTTTICYLDLRLFQRMYVCPQACKEGWKVGCRRIIGLDGCFLKGYFQGYLLLAVGVDANDCIYPIAYAAVESENMSSWYWFVEILKTDLEIDNSFNICFMSDKHKLKALSEAAYTWVKDKDPAQWSRSHFSNRSKCDMLLNNHCESFNKSISEARDKPILTMMETIRTKIMVRIVSKREAAEKCKGFWPTYAGAHKYQVEVGPSHQHVVDLVERSCSCRKWDLTGIPCSHAASVFRLNNLKPEDYVNECYHNSTQLAIYSNMIRPIKGPFQWTLVTDMEPILPPIIRRPPGRPTKKRKLEPGEVNNPKLSKRGQQGNCTKCGKQGHNSRTCRGEVGANQPIRRPTFKRPKPSQPQESQQNQNPQQPQQPRQNQLPQQPQQPHVPRREKFPIMRQQPLPPPTYVRLMPSQESIVTNPPTQESQSATRE